MAQGIILGGGGAKINGTLESLTVAAGKTVNKGDFVALKMAASVGSSVAIDTLTSANNFSVSKYGNTIFVACREVISSTYYLTVKAIDVSGASPTTMATLRTAVEYGGNGTQTSIYAISETRCIVGYNATMNGTTLTYKQLVVNGTTFDTAATTTSTYGGSSTVYVAAGKYAICTPTSIVIATFTDTSIAIAGTGYTIGAGSSVNQPVAYLSDNKLIYVQNTAGSLLSVCVLSVSGTVVSSGTAATVTQVLAGSSYATSICAVSGTAAVVLTAAGGTLVFTVNGTTVTPPNYPHYTHVGSSGSWLVKITSGKIALFTSAGIIPCAVKACYVCDTAEYSITSLYPFAHTGNKVISLLMSASAISAIIATITETVEPAGTARAIYGIAKTGGATGETVSVFVPA